MRLLALGALLGTLLCALILRLLPLPGAWESQLSLGPLGFDLYTVSFFVRINPGTFLGLILGGVLFRSLP